MGNLFANRLANSRSIRTSGTGEIKSEFGVVYEVILDENHPSLTNIPNKAAHIGAIKFRAINDAITNEKDTPFAFPKDPNTKTLPTINEIVKISRNGAGMFEISPISEELFS